MNKEQAAFDFHRENIYGETTGNRVHHLVEDAFIAGATWQEQQNKVNIPVPNELIEQINILHSCLVEAPVDFLGTGGIGSNADKEEKEWIKTYTAAYIKTTELLQHTHPHSTYMEFAEWCSLNALYSPKYNHWLTEAQDIYHPSTPDLFQYWITNVKNKG